MNIVSLVIDILLAGLIVYAVYWFIGILNLPSTIKNIIMVIVAILALVWLMRLFGFA